LIGVLSLELLVSESSAAHGHGALELVLSLDHFLKLVRLHLLLEGVFRHFLSIGGVAATLQVGLDVRVNSLDSVNQVGRVRVFLGRLTLLQMAAFRLPINVFELEMDINVRRLLRVFDVLLVSLALAVINLRNTFAAQSIASFPRLNLLVGHLLRILSTALLK